MVAVSARLTAAAWGWVVMAAVAMVEATVLQVVVWEWAVVATETRADQELAAGGKRSVS